MYLQCIYSLFGIYSVYFVYSTDDNEKQKQVLQFDGQGGVEFKSILGCQEFGS